MRALLAFLRDCAPSPTLQRDGHNVAITQECTTITLRQVVLIAVAVVVATGCAFSLAACICRARFRILRAHWNAVYELQDNAGAHLCLCVCVFVFALVLCWRSVSTVYVCVLAQTSRAFGSACSHTT